MAGRLNAINVFAIMELAEDDLNYNVLNELVGDLAQPVPINLLEGRPRVRRPRNENFAEQTIPRFTDDLFKEHFRMSRMAFQDLCNVLGNNVVHNRDNIDFQKKILFTIWTLAKPESFLAVGDRFGIARSTAHGIFKNIILAIANLLPQYIRFPNEQEMLVSASNFQARSNGFPGVIGAVDGCHIPIKQPPGNANDYYNRKGFHSIILQGTCDHLGRLIDIYVGLPGRMHDARVFRNSPLYERMVDPQNPIMGENFHLLGDCAYPLLLNLMRPFVDNHHLTEERTRYNIKLSSIRSVIERTFGMLKGKFRRLKFLDISDMQLGNNIITAACVLHNFLIHHNEFNIHEEVDIENIEEDGRLPVLQDVGDIAENAAILKRNNIVTLLT